MTLVWLRHDLRLADNPALMWACRRGPVVVVYLWSPDEEGAWPPGAASRWWLHHSLTALANDLEQRGSRMIVRRGPALATLRQLATETGATAVVWNRRYEPFAIARDAVVKRELKADGLAVESFNASLLREPWQVRRDDGAPFTVYTPFARAHADGPAIAQPLPEPDTLSAPAHWPASLPLAELELLPKRNWADDWLTHWTPGEAGAHERAAQWYDAFGRDYARLRNTPSEPATSRLSPHLHFGEIGPRQLWHGLPPDATFRRELLWREFGYSLLFHFPHTSEATLRSEWSDFPYRHDPGELRRWQRGQTGYPVVDAGMRELWATGWMHNRVRMVVASFLTRDLLHSWHDGAKWFWDTLVCADIANNNYGWQWAAGCGADTADYPRIFNPVVQGEKFDPQGTYVRRWVPELAGLPDEFVHKPWDAPPDVLLSAGVELVTAPPGPRASSTGSLSQDPVAHARGSGGKNAQHSYPTRIVDHAWARRRAVEAWESAMSGEADLFNTEGKVGN